MKVLAVIAEPTDLPRFGGDRVWAELAMALGAQVTRAPEATEAGLKRALAEAKYDAVHLVVHGEERRAANYGTIALVNSEGKARKVTGPALASLLAGVPFVVLQACDEASLPMSAVAAAMAAQVPVVRVAPPRAPLFEIYAELMRPAGVAAPLVAVTASAMAPAWQEEIRHKRAAGEFDVFLCHNWADKAAVLAVAQRLKEAGVLPWLDAWELPPGQPWQRLLEQQIGTIRAAAVFVGAAGLGPWQEQELDGFLREFVKRRCPVIPVLLPDAPAQPALPLFLQAMTWVDFRQADQDSLGRLVWGITGRRPEGW